MSKLSIELPDESATLSVGRLLAASCRKSEGLVIYLSGNLGMGKTTLTRGWLRAMGYDGAVKSPTYTLVESYQTGEKNFYHFDLYRLMDPEELEFMGVRDYFDGQSICVIEWPDKGEGLIASPDLEIKLSVHGYGRMMEIEAGSSSGTRFLDDLRRLHAVKHT